MNRLDTIEEKLSKLEDRFERISINPVQRKGSESESCLKHCLTFVTCSAAMG
jgi:hypothetical protein